MKIFKPLTLLASCLILISSSVSAKNAIKLESTEENKVNLDVGQFGKYLHDGSPDAIEGIYKSPDNRYHMALIKNDAKTHDFIGVVISADNPYWKEGEVKFNFVRNDSDQLTGYYYNSKGKAFPVTFKVGKSTIKSKLLRKMKLKDIPTDSLAILY